MRSEPTKQQRSAAPYRAVRPYLRWYPAVMLYMAFPLAGDAETFFNPTFLSDDPSAIADLSRFDKGEGQPPGIYRVEIYVNAEYAFSRDIAFQLRTPSDKPSSDDTGLEPCLPIALLEQLNVNLQSFPSLRDEPASACINVPQSIPDASVRFDFELQRLNISLPQIALKNAGRGYIPPEEWDEGITSALFNYQFTGSNTHGDARSDSYFLNLDSGVNWNGWRLRDYSTWRYSRYANQRYNEFQHVSTYLQRAIIPWRSELTLGDSNTVGEVFDSLGFRGVQIASDDAMLPDSLRGFAPTIRGIAKSNARVTIRQNGYVIYQAYVAPGAFEITDLYPTSSSGDLQVTITESDNSTNSFVVPYSAVPLLQRENRMKYSAMVGKYRSNNPQQDQPLFGQGTLIWGRSAGVTLYGGTQLAEDYQALTLGSGKNLGDWGAFSADLTQAYSTLSDGSDHKGQSLRFLYAKSLNDLGTNFQILGYRYSTKGFFTLDEASYKNMSGYTVDFTDVQPVVRDYYNLNNAKKSRMQMNITQQLGKGMGSLFLTGSRQDYWHTKGTNDLLQVGYSNVYRGVSYNLSYSYNKNQGLEERNQLFAFNLSVPLSQWLSGHREGINLRRSQNTAYASYNMTSDNQGRTLQQVGLSGTMLSDGNLNYNVSQGYGNRGIGNSGNAGLGYQGTYGNSNANYNYTRNTRQLNYGVSGGVVAHADGVTFSQPLGDTNVLIKVPGTSRVKVENTTGIQTDWRGYAVIPYASVYRNNRIALDVNSLNQNTEINNTVANLVPTRGAIVRASFTAYQGGRALISLQQRNGRPVPFGALVSRVDSDSTGIVGDDGQVFLSGLTPEGELKVAWGSGSQQQCTLRYALPDGSENQPVSYTKAVCQ
ncbi:fimbrial biogenesis usher protein [Pectobacterium aroidearum]|uniref:fimbrial biogenesis usher protein n=1 Tax=Pectobacterium aroidearum TaxID=1201031 RepID=UPI00211468D8|nr:fimbrial biogenesis usher protein [Pectobacterium aroidearum]UUE46869.1 fimbrial biogenesis usher protein [Pectobacterium aroidearum]UUE51066.1 fimbrial biogenesis usher protein [Pectobacterium aroidearum]UUE55294.1 fimbrial biogenesis usher protein [Pectobacterium aroidearum]UUE63703.1 fimbrial biogenesis usher protein [Pectobacterium aroidearum]UUE67927.1 fimbrial biogenesis usher protein [Pectobacterium aroidearum]